MPKSAFYHIFHYFSFFFTRFLFFQLYILFLATHLGLIQEFRSPLKNEFLGAQDFSIRNDYARLRRRLQNRRRSP